jgi:APA family basic amino acid/polyamine antiporter
MASRVLYGLASKGHIPAWLATVHHRAGTPHYATLLAGTFVLALALWFPLDSLAERTSAVTLVVFTMVNLALWRVKSRAETQRASFSVPRWVPIVGACSTSLLLLVRMSEAVFN